MSAAISIINIKFNKNTFNNYSNLISSIHTTLTKITDPDDVVNKKEITTFLASIKELLLKERKCELYEEIKNFNLHVCFVDLIKKYSKAEFIDLYRAVLSCVIPMTDISEIMCTEFVKIDLPSVLIDETLKVCGENFKMPKGTNVEDVVGQLISIIHNIARHTQFQQSFTQNEKVKSLKSKLRQYLKSKGKRMTILVMSVLTWLAVDDGYDYILLETHSNIIDNFIDYIAKAINDKNRRCEGWEVWELLSVLYALSTTGSIKNETFLTSKSIETIIKLFKDKSSHTNELEIALDILWNLSFTDNYKDKLKTEFKIEIAIKYLVYNTNENISNRALDFLKDLSYNHQEQKPSKTVYDIFVSYCHAQNAIVKKLVIELKKKFKVWIDTEEIKGNGWSDMAKGVEDSKVLLMGVSNSYKQSRCCHSEALWAIRLNKPIIPLIMEYKYKPNGWLGMVISPETYINVSNEKNMDEIVKEIEVHINNKC